MTNHALQLQLGDVFKLAGALGEAFGQGITRGLNPPAPKLALVPRPAKKAGRKAEHVGCSVKWCRGKHYAKTLCGKHYKTTWMALRAGRLPDLSK